MIYALVGRAGSGQTLHHATPHGVSSLRLGCGRTVLRTGVRTSDERPEKVPPGTRDCTRCTKAVASDA